KRVFITNNIYIFIGYLIYVSLLMMFAASSTTTTINNSATNEMDDVCTGL
nr:hypothetical protein [Tanacetum cinerariifolium]